MKDKVARAAIARAIELLMEFAELTARPRVQENITQHYDRFQTIRDSLFRLQNEMLE